MIESKKSTIEVIREKFIEKTLTNIQLKLQIFINTLIHYEKKYNLAISKSVDILSKFISN